MYEKIPCKLLSIKRKPSNLSNKKQQNESLLPIHLITDSVWPETERIERERERDTKMQLNYTYNK